MKTLGAGAFLMLLPFTAAMIGYDCSGQHLNVTTISLIDVDECEPPASNLEHQETYIQLLQLSGYNFVTAIQCKVEISRTIYYCGMHSHVSPVEGGYNEYIHDIDATRCSQIHATGELLLGNEVYLIGLKINQTANRAFTLAGSLSVDGKCQGVKYSDPFGSWENVVVQAVAKITTQQVELPVQLDTNKIILKSGTKCNFQDNYCIDPEDGHTFWNSFPPSPCDFDRYDVLYEGLANRVTDTSANGETPTVYALTTKDVTFALAKIGESVKCGYTLIRTEHPKLFVLETTKDRTFISRKKIPVENLDIFTYVNSKFVYVEKHIRTQISTLYQNLVMQRCLLDRRVIANAMAIATINPDEFAYAIVGKPGHMALVAGEVAHIVKCIPVNVKIRHSNDCFAELPILRGNSSFFLTPKSHIITRHGTHRDCNPILPVLYKIDDTWHRINPKPLETIPPQTLHPTKRPQWRYISPSTLATSGIYSQTDVENLREHIMFPAEKAAILNTIARGAGGRSMGTGYVSLAGMLDEESLTRIAENTIARFWEGFITFGSVSAGIIAIFFIIKVFKMLLDMILRGYELHTAYGCGFQLLGAMWSTIANFLIRRAKDHNSSNNTELGSHRSYNVEAIEPAPAVHREPTPPVRRTLREQVATLEQISLGNLHVRGGGVTSRNE